MDIDNALYNEETLERDRGDDFIQFLICTNIVQTFTGKKYKTYTFISVLEFIFRLDKYFITTNINTEN